MNRAAEVLQRSLFAAIEADADLAAAFAVHGAAMEQAQFAYDGMQSVWRNRPLGLSEHVVSLSVWVPHIGLADGQDLLNAVQAMMQQLAVPEGYRIRQYLVLSRDDGVDRTSRQWRHVLRFQFLLQATAVLPDQTK